MGRFLAGQTKPQRSGRRKGTPNRTSDLLHVKAEELGVDALEVLLLYAKGDWQKLGYASDVITPEMRMSAASTLCPYFYPKLKAVEAPHQAENADARTFTELIASIAAQKI